MEKHLITLTPHPELIHTHTHPHTPKHTHTYARGHTHAHTKAVLSQGRTPFGLLEKLEQGTWNGGGGAGSG